MSDFLSVAELYGPVVQGEGQSAGEVVSFLRLSGCNLACSWCDTPYTWNWTGTKFEHPEKFDKSNEVIKLTALQVKKKIDGLGSYRLVISGGEPFLQQHKLLPLLKLLKSHKYFIEVETNGTIAPLPEFLELVDQINCSPKTSNSGVDNRELMRERPIALNALSESPKTTFKFVVSSMVDLKEITYLVAKYNMKQVYLMPQGRTRVEQLKNQGTVKMMAELYDFKFSPRLHVLEFDNKRGV